MPIWMILNSLSLGVASMPQPICPGITQRQTPSLPSLCYLIQERPLDLEIFESKVNLEIFFFFLIGFYSLTIVT